MSPPNSREQQRFPVLDRSQIEITKRFASGEARYFPPGQPVFAIGERGAPCWLVLDGTIDVVRRDGLTLQVPVTTYRAGQFTGEVSQLAGKPALASAHAGAAGCTALPFDAAHLRALVIGSADVGEIIMRAFILRRVALIENGSGSVLIGVSGTTDLVRLQGFLSRNAYPHAVLDALADEEGRALVERLGVLSADLPLMICPNGEILRNPRETAAAACLGMTPELDASKIYDVAIVGAGPAGLAAAVYASSEGLSTIVLDERAIGGQAGASARVENYLGFPTGISGFALAGRAFNQALKFGAEIFIPVEVLRLDSLTRDKQPDDPLKLTLAGGCTISARTMIIASGARYRRPEVPDLSMFEGAGVSYWASPIEAKLCEGEEVALIGGGNSAGQAVVFLAAHVKRLHLVVRRSGLEATMSRYLIDRIKALPNVELHADCELAALEGDSAGLSGATFRSLSDGASRRLPLRHLFLFIGADPNAAWLQGCVASDDKGFVLTGKDFQGEALSCGRASLPLETNLPGVFAIGDVRSGSTKRIAAAVGDGAAVIAQIHAALAFQSAQKG
jgi:thioredoxin reductase (NADPH)